MDWEAFIFLPFFLVCFSFVGAHHIIFCENHIITDNRIIACQRKSRAVLRFNVNKFCLERYI